MAFSGDKLEERYQWSKLRSRIVLSLCLIGLLLLLSDAKSRGYALVGLGLLVTIMLHEAGHFIAAKWAKMKATEFFVGFGPRIWSFKKGETEYGIKAIPLGGYVKIIGMTNLDEVDEQDEHRTYRKGQTRKKLVVIMAGVVVNMLLAYLLIFVSLVGQGVPKAPNDARAIIDTVLPGSAADHAGLKHGDMIIKINDSRIATFHQLSKTLEKYAIKDNINITYQRNSRTYTRSITLKPAVDETGHTLDRPALGVTSGAEYERVGVIEASVLSGKALVRTVGIATSSMARLFSPSGISSYSNTVVKGDYERQDRPSSIAGIVNVGGEMVNQDLWSLLGLLAIINIFLALLNALPLLPLDGGHAAVAIYERIASTIMKREIYVNYKKLMPFVGAVIGIFMILSLSALWLDILQMSS